jgi:hypothetical protein
VGRRRGFRRADGLIDEQQQLSSSITSTDLDNNEDRMAPSVPPHLEELLKLAPLSCNAFDVELSRRR